MITRNTITQLPAKKEGRISNSSMKPVKGDLQSEHHQLLRGSPAMKSIVQSVREKAMDNLGVFVKVDFRYKKVMNEDIYLVEAFSDYVKIFTKEKCYTIHSTLYSILEKLPKADFIRVHRSYIVRMDRVSEIDDNNDIMVVEGKVISIGKKFKNELMTRLNVFY